MRITSRFQYFSRKKKLGVFFSWPCVIVLFATLAIAIPYAEAFNSNELKLKVLYLYNFSKLTAWPASRFASQNTPVNICIYGNGQYADEAKGLTKKNIRKHPIQIRTINKLAQVSACHVLFVTKDAEHPRKFLKKAYQHDVLTSGDGGDFIKNGGIIGLITINNKIRFEINLGAINNNQLKISSKLLRLAKAVYHKPVSD